MFGVIFLSRLFCQLFCEENCNVLSFENWVVIFAQKLDKKFAVYTSLVYK